MSFTRHQQCSVEDTNASNNNDVTKLPLGLNFVKYQGKISFGIWNSVVSKGVCFQVSTVVVFKTLLKEAIFIRNILITIVFFPK